ncbi:MAG: hypothetical protein ACMG55_18810, partial [Microcoleus sp.]
NMLTKINQSGTDILMLSDSYGGGSTALGFDPETVDNSGRFVNAQVNYPHFVDQPGQSIDDSVELQFAIFDWIFDENANWSQ